MSDTSYGEDLGSLPTKIGDYLTIDRNHNGYVLIASNLWSRDLDSAQIDLAALKDYLAAREEFKRGNTPQLEERIRTSSSIARLYEVAERYSDQGLVVLAGLIEPLFREFDLKKYDESRKAIRQQNGVSDENILAYALQSLEDSKKEPFKIPEFAFNACRNLLNLGKDAIALGEERYSVFEKLIRDHGVIGVAGKACHKEWSELGRDGVRDFVDVDRHFRVAYFGGRNFNWKAERVDVPIELFIKPGENELYGFLRSLVLKDANPFDLLVYSGTVGELSNIVERINRDFPLKTGRSWFRKQKQDLRLKNKVFVVTDPSIDDPNFQVWGEGKNLFISGVNYRKTQYAPDRFRGGNVLLIDPKSDPIRLAVLGRPKPSEPARVDADDRWSRLFKIKQGYEFSNGVVRECAFIDREKLEKLGESTGSFSQSIMPTPTIQKAIEEKRKAELKRQKREERTEMIKDLLMYAAFLGVGAGLGYGVGRLQANITMYEANVNLKKARGTIEKLLETLEKSQGSESK